MSKLIKSSFQGMYGLGKFLYNGYMVEKEIGARLATKKEINQLLQPSHRGVLMDGVNKRMTEKKSFEHVAIVSPPGGGKSSGYIVPNILDRAKQKSSMLITDPSGEIFANTSQHLSKKGYEILVLDPSDLSVSAKFNPYSGLDHRHLIEIERISASIILSKYGNDKEQVWNEGAISLLEVFAKCLAYTCPDYLNIPNLNYLVQRFGEDGEALDDWVADHSVNPSDLEDKTILYAWMGITSSDPKMLKTYTTIVKTALKQFNNREIQKLFYDNDIDFTAFRKRKTAVYIRLPENQASYFQFLVNMFYAKFFSVMMEHRPAKNELSVFCFLDEFGSSYVNQFSMIINNIRKYRVSLSLVFQGLSQLEEKYGQQQAKSIKAGIGTTLVFAGADYQTAKEMSDRIGNKVTLKKKDKGFNDDVDGYASTPLVSPDKIRTLNDNQALFISGNQHGFFIDLLPFYVSQSPFLKLARKGAYQLPVKQNNQLPFQLNI